MISSIHQCIKKMDAYSTPFKALLWLPAVSVIVGLWKACILTSQLNAQEKLAPFNSPKDQFNACVPLSWQFACLSYIFNAPMIVDFALLVLAQTILTVSLPIFAKALLIIAGCDAIGRITIGIYCLYKQIPYRDKHPGTPDYLKYSDLH